MSTDPTTPEIPCCQSVFEALAAYQANANTQQARAVTQVSTSLFPVFNDELSLVTTQIQTSLTEALQLCKPKCCAAYANAVAALGNTTLTQYVDILISTLFPYPGVAISQSGYGNLEVLDEFSPDGTGIITDENLTIVIDPVATLNAYLLANITYTAVYTQAQKDILLTTLIAATFTGNRFLYQAQTSFLSSLAIMDSFAVCPPSSTSTSDATQCYELDKKKKCRKTKSKKTKKCKPCGN